MSTVYWLREASERHFAGSGPAQSIGEAQIWLVVTCFLESVLDRMALWEKVHCVYWLVRARWWDTVVDTGRSSVPGVVGKMEEDERN